MKKNIIIISLFVNLCFTQMMNGQLNKPDSLQINESGYYEMPGLDVMLFDDFYPEGHQGGLTIVQHGVRVAANGDVRLEPTPGQWSPIPKIDERIVDTQNQKISVRLSYPDKSRDRIGFNPIVYPDLNLNYTVKTEAVGKSLKVIVDLEKPLPKEFCGKVGFNLEFFPGLLFGEFYLMDGKSGSFPKQFVSPAFRDKDGDLQITPLAVGRQLTIAPGKTGKEIRIISSINDLQLIDGRGLHNNGWFIARSFIPQGKTKNAIEWTITPLVDSNWQYKPVIQISQVGFHPDQEKFAVVELDRQTVITESIQLIKISETDTAVIKKIISPELWGNFLRYKYIRFDFSEIKDEGIYKIKYGQLESNEFEIRKDIYSNNFWQPTLNTFLPVQMCHMRIEDRYKVWHGLCHMDDALMSPINHNHFDGYIQHSSTLTNYNPGEHITGLNVGGWHDAGDFDLRIESQDATIYKLSLAYELFKEDYDQTTIDQQKRIVRLHQPDGKPDILQQIEHGVLSIVGSYESMGRLYRGIICSTLKQYVHLGDPSTITDNIVYDEKLNDTFPENQLPKDDRWVFTEENPEHEFYTAQTLSAAYRVLRKFNPELSAKCLTIAKELFKLNSNENGIAKINAAAELYLSTSEEVYKDILLRNTDLISNNVLSFSEVLGRINKKLNNSDFTSLIEKSVTELFNKILADQKENPYGVPYKPNIWGAGWGIQSFGEQQLFLHLGFPKIFSSEYVFNSLNFILGCHPGENNASFVSGLGVNSLTVAYGFNRDEWSYIPGGIGSGTALIRPDLPELKIWPYFWQQTEYVLGGGTVDFLLIAMSADHLLNNKIIY